MTGAENLLLHLVGFPKLRGWQQEQVLGLDIAMNEVGFPQEFDSTGKLLQEVTDDNLVQARVGSDGVFAREFVGGRVRNQFVPLLDEQRQISQLAVFHNKIDVRSRLDAVMEGNYMGVTKPPENLDFAIKVFF